MYRIGQFSKIGMVTVKALRFYEEEGLIAPCHVDAATGYRYYDSGQLPSLHQIVALRQCGFPIPEIRQILAGRNVAALFAERKRALESELRAADAMLASVGSYIESLKDGGVMRYQIVVKELPGGIVFSKRMLLSSYEDYFTEIPRIGQQIAAANPGLRCVEDPPYCFIEYHDGEYKERDIDVELQELVVAWGEETADIKFKRIERVPEAACVLHKGPYSELRGAYAAAFKWIDDNGRIPAGNPRESYIDGIWNRPDPADWLTEVQVPLLSLG